MQRERDLKRAANILARGGTLEEVAKTNGTSKMTAKRDKDMIRARWQQEANIDVDAVFGELDAMYRTVYRDAYSRFHRSEGIHRTTVNEDGTGAQGKIDKTKTTEELLCGDPRYLKIALDAIDRLKQLHGAGKEPEPPVEGIDLGAGYRTVQRMAIAHVERAIEAMDRGDLFDAEGTGMEISMEGFADPDRPEAASSEATGDQQSQMP